MKHLWVGLVAVSLSVPSAALAGTTDPIEALQEMFLALAKERNCILRKKDFEEFGAQMDSLHLSRADRERLEDVVREGKFLNQPRKKFAVLESDDDTVEFKELCE